MASEFVQPIEPAVPAGTLTAVSTTETLSLPVAGLITRSGQLSAEYAIVVERMIDLKPVALAPTVFWACADADNAASPTMNIATSIFLPYIITNLL